MNNKFANDESTHTQANAPETTHSNKETPDTEIRLLKAELSRVKEALSEAEKNTESALRVKSEFLANVSHEIRTPLNAILGFSQWLFENTPDIQHREYLATILKSARNLLNLLNNILDLSKIESGKIHIDFQPMNYQEVIDDIKLVFQQKVEEKGLSMKITTDSTVPDFIFMDELKFYQIIFNLVSNAIKFTGSGNIHLWSRAENTGNDDEINLIITVEDTGIGIKEHLQKIIFDNFTQGYNDKVYEGTGLGLAIVNGLVKKLNGSVSIKSKPGKGSAFTVTFHQVKTDHEEFKRVESKRDGAALKIGPCKIMIVDDISYNRLVLKQLISSEDAVYIEANDGTDALAKLKTEKPDLIFMDIRMPGLSGFDVTEIIKQDDELKTIPVIAFTGSTIKDSNSRIYNLFDGYLQKPVFKRDLEKVLKRFLRFSYVTNSGQIKLAPDSAQPISKECFKILPKLLDETRKNFIPVWNELKDTLIIFEIEAFNNDLAKMGTGHSCEPILKYCKELDKALENLDVELIKRKLNEFPQLIENLESHNQK